MKRSLLFACLGILASCGQAQARDDDRISPQSEDIWSGPKWIEAEAGDLEFKFPVFTPYAQDHFKVVESWEYGMPMYLVDVPDALMESQVNRSFNFSIYISDDCKEVTNVFVQQMMRAPNNVSFQSFEKDSKKVVYFMLVEFNALFSTASTFGYVENKNSDFCFGFNAGSNGKGGEQLPKLDPQDFSKAGKALLTTIESVKKQD